MVVNLPAPINWGNILKKRNLPNSPLNKPIILKGLQPNNIDWEGIALTDPEVNSLLYSGFRWLTNCADPDKANDPKQAQKAREVLDETVKRLTTEFGTGAVCVIKSAYDMSGRPYKGGVAIWVCDVKPDDPIIEPEAAAEKSPEKIFFL